MEIHYYNLLNSGTILKGGETSFRGGMPEFISRTSTDTNPLLGLYSRQTLKSDILSSTELENDRVGAGVRRRRSRRLRNSVHRRIHCLHRKCLLLRRGICWKPVRRIQMYSSLTLVNKVLWPKINFEKTENKLIAMIHQENTQEQEAANQHRCH